MSDTNYTVLSTEVFKAHLCRHLNALARGEYGSDLIITRYGKPAAYVFSHRQITLNREAKAAEQALAAHRHALACHALQRRRIAAHALTNWPPEKFFRLRRPRPALRNTP